MNMPLLSIELDRADCRFILEALQAMKSQWVHINRTTTDEDEQADYGNDVILLGMTLENFEAAALQVFGSSVKNFSRAPAGSVMIPSEL